MPLVATVPALMATIGAGTSVATGILGSRAAGKAANVQAESADNAAILQKQAADDALGFNREMFDTQQRNQQPWLQAGGGAVMSLSDMLNPGGELAQSWDKEFKAPTEVDEQNDPGYQFRMKQGQQAIERSAAAKGGVLSGGTLKALSRYGQDYGSNEYQNVYNRSKDAYQMAYNQFQQKQSDRFNRLASLSGLGQTAAGQLNNTGSAVAGQNAGILQNSANSIGNSQESAAAARASGYVGNANVWGNTLGSLSNIFGQYGSLKSLGQIGQNADV